jgi:hypothetical protein
LALQIGKRKRAGRYHPITRESRETRLGGYLFLAHARDGGAKLGRARGDAGALGQGRKAGEIDPGALHLARQADRLAKQARRLAAPA